MSGKQKLLFSRYREPWPAGKRGNDAETLEIPSGQSLDRPSAQFENLPQEIQSYGVERYGEHDCWILSPGRMSLAEAVIRYGSVFKNGKNRAAHRVSWEHFMGPIPYGALIDHLCEIRRCLNPAHLELVRPGENTRRHHARRASENAFSGRRDVLYRTYRMIVCPVCGDEFQKARDWHTYCSDKCRIKAHKDKDHPRADLSRERRARDRAMGVAAGKNDDQLETVRLVARELAAKGRPITIDDVRDECERRGLKIVWGNWTGSVFKEVIWEPVGFAQARHKGSHARVVRKWMLER